MQPPVAWSSKLSWSWVVRAEAKRCKRRDKEVKRGGGDGLWLGSEEESIQGKNVISGFLLVGKGVGKFIQAIDNSS